MLPGRYSRLATWSARLTRRRQFSKYLCGPSAQRERSAAKTSLMESNVEFVAISTLNGVVHGLLLFMVSAGLTLIFGMMGVLNFAHAWFYMVGAYIGFSCSRTIGFWPGLVVAPILVGVLGIAIERFMLRRVHAFGHAHELLLTFGLAFIIEELIKVFYGDFPVNYAMPPYMKFTAFTIYEINYPFYRLFMGGIAIAMFALLYVLLTRTRVGLIVRAATDRPHMVEALGHNLPIVFMAVFAVGAGLAGLAGAVAGDSFPPVPTWVSISEPWYSWWWWLVGSGRWKVH